MLGYEKSNIDLSREDAFEKIQSNPSLVEECKLDRTAETENVDGTHDVFQDFQPVAFFVFHRHRRPRSWFIRLVTWPYPFSAFKLLLFYVYIC